MTNDIFDGLKPYCKKDERMLLNRFKNQGFAVRELSNGDYYAFQDNGSNVLAVAHMDISSRILNEQAGYRLDGDRVYSPALDDRLGVFIITKILPMLGVMPDILLTTGEEKGQSTGMHFDTYKEYNWMFSFDRTGDDVVMYDYETVALSRMLEERGFIVGIGSFSDICFMEHLKVSGFNFGTGYYGEHTKKCFADLNVTRMMVSLFVEFFNEFKNIRLDYVPVPWDERWGRVGNYENWNAWINDDEDEDDIYDGDAYYDNGELRSLQEAIQFEDNHAMLGHDVDTFLIDDVSMCMVCFDCDIEICFYG